MSSITKPVSTVIVTNLLMAAPAFAEGKLFDFGLTLPIMAGQFLLLMVFLDKTWFTPVGKVLDERDELIRSKLAAVQGDSSKLVQMQEEAEKMLKEARDAATAAVNEARATTQAEQDIKMESLREVRRLLHHQILLGLAATAVHCPPRTQAGLFHITKLLDSINEIKWSMLLSVQQLDRDLANSVREVEVEREKANSAIGEQVR